MNCRTIQPDRISLVSGNCGVNPFLRPGFLHFPLVGQAGPCRFNTNIIGGLQLQLQISRLSRDADCIRTQSSLNLNDFISLFFDFFNDFIDYSDFCQRCFFNFFGFCGSEGDSIQLDAFIIHGLFAGLIGIDFVFRQIGKAIILHVQFGGFTIHIGHNADDVAIAEFAFSGHAGFGEDNGLFIDRAGLLVRVFIGEDIAGGQGRQASNESIFNNVFHNRLFDDFLNDFFYDRFGSRGFDHFLDGEFRSLFLNRFFHGRFNGGDFGHFLDGEFRSLLLDRFFHGRFRGGGFDHFLNGNFRSLFLDRFFHGRFRGGNFDDFFGGGFFRLLHDDFFYDFYRLVSHFFHRGFDWSGLFGDFFYDFNDLVDCRRGLFSGFFHCRSFCGLFDDDDFLCWGFFNGQFNLVRYDPSGDAGEKHRHGQQQAQPFLLFHFASK